MTVNRFHVFALAATLALGGAMSAHAASDDQIKYRDGKPVGQNEMAGEKPMPEKPMDGKAMDEKSMGEKPMAHSGKAMHGKHHTKKASAKRGHHAKRSPSVKHLRGHSETPRSRL